MLTTLAGLTLELVPHCASVPRTGWTGSHDPRPLSADGHRQARDLVAALGTGIAAVYSSPALRCRQTVEPLATAAGLAVTDMAEWAEADDFREPEAWTKGVFAGIAGAVGGAWSAGRGLRAALAIGARHPGARVVASSHGDVIPVLVATLCAVYGAPVPVVPDRGGWYTLGFGDGSLTITTHGEVYSG
ncbi:histidine phosphatase family protein [Longispora sp. NPDC051575]|uniref:histidine phosphatase family protein n=1 Tax=Longispora sp. NPDC051575 TaxID=3154943 RepID=UPI00344317F6